MTTKNNISLQSWNYESTVQTAVISAADSVSYEYGQYDQNAGKWEAPSIQNKIEQHYAHAYRNPYLTVPSREFPTFKLNYKPTQPIFIHRILGSSTNASPPAVTSIKHTGLKKSFNHRWQHSGGTNPQVINALSCYAVQCYVSGQAGKPLEVEEQVAWGKIEDQNTRVALTTNPIHPDSITSMYDGLPTVKILNADTQAEITTLSEVYWAEFTIKQDFTTVKSTDGNTQTIYLGNISEISGNLHAVYEQNQQWDDLLAKTKRDLTIKYIKQSDITKYLTFTFDDIYFESAKKSGIPLGSFYEEIIPFRASNITATFNYEGAAFSTFFA